MILESLRGEFQRYKSMAEMAVGQLRDEQLYETLGEDGNSVAVLMRHVSGNLKSRFTNFLTEDGEKPWRDRESEFDTPDWSRSELLERWDESWSILFRQLDSLTDAGLGRAVRIRGLELSVSGALMRSVAHTALHAGQIIFVARTLAGKNWQSLSIPRGKSREYNLNPTKERSPR